MKIKKEEEWILGKLTILNVKVLSFFFQNKNES